MSEDDIPINADHWLFAEDLINFVFRNHIGFPINPIGEECREFVHERFTETVRNAVEITERKLLPEIEAVFAEMSSKAQNVIEAYLAYIYDLRKVGGSGGFDGSQFLHYCVFASCLGERFYRTGLEEFHYLAFTAVRQALERHDMSNGGWGTLELAVDAITSVEEHSGNLPSPEYESPGDEQSALDLSTLQRHVNRTCNILHEDIDSLSEASSSSESSGEKHESSDFADSAESPDFSRDSEEYSESVSSDYSSSSYLVSRSKKPTQSNTVSSSSDISKLSTATDNYLKDYTGNSTAIADYKFALKNSLHEKTVDSHDLSKDSYLTESCSGFQLNEPSSECSSLSVQSNKNTETVSKKLRIHSENSSEVENTRKENIICSSLPCSHHNKQLLKRRSESRNFEKDRKLPPEAQTQNSTECTDSVSKISNDSKSISE